MAIAAIAAPGPSGVPAGTIEANMENGATSSARAPRTPLWVCAELHAWMFDAAIPAWLGGVAVHALGGPEESLTLDGRGPAGAAFRRTRVCARQIYVMSHAALLLQAMPGRQGQADAARACALAYFEHFADRMWMGPDRGWLRTIAPDNSPLDETLDLYDHAFAVFALGWLYRAFGDARARVLAHATLDVLEGRLRHPGGLGFHHAWPATGPRQQNPHMHLCEAALVWAQMGGEPRFAALADEMARLCTRHLVRMPEGVLPEFFDADWAPLAKEAGQRVEPGHLFEWAWILAQHHKLTGHDHAPVIGALVRWAERHGVDPGTQITYNALHGDGAVIDRGSRVWPNTERMKGWIGAHEAIGLDPWPAVVGSAAALLDRFLAPAPRGMWIDALDAQGAGCAPNIPTSTLYHLFLAFAETLRISPSPQTAGD